MTYKAGIYQMMWCYCHHLRTSIKVAKFDFRR